VSHSVKQTLRHVLHPHASEPSPYCGLRELRSAMVLVSMRRVAFGPLALNRRHTGQLGSDHLGHLGPDTGDQPLDAMRNGAELLDGRNLLIPQHLPHLPGQMEPPDRASADLVRRVRHLSPF
jgi:hypothetical protein